MTDVLNFVRKTYYKPHRNCVQKIYCKPHLKSGNKVYRNGGPKEWARQEKATIEVERIRSQPDLIRAAMKGKAHQCQELAILALHHLNQRGLEPKLLDLGGDDEAIAHSVAVIGPASNPLPADMKDWHPDVYVCDPWSNIACRARDYPDEFTRKMEKWEAAGKLVGFKTEALVVPTDPRWLREVLHGTKTV